MKKEELKKNWLLEHDGYKDIHKYSSDPVQVKRMVSDFNASLDRGLKRWECLRRKKEYRDNFERTLCEDKKVKGCLRTTLPKYVDPRIDCTELIGMMNTEGIWVSDFILNLADVSRDNPIRVKDPFNFTWIDEKDPPKLEVWHQNGNSKVVLGLKKSMEAVPRKLTLEIDLTFNKTDLLRSFELIISEYKQYCSRLMVFEHREPISWDRFNRAMKVYDLRGKKVKFTDMADKWAGPEDDFDSVVVQCKRDFKFAKDLIEGDGYRKIS